MPWINGIQYDNNGQVVGAQGGTPAGIGGAPAGRSPYYGMGLDSYNPANHVVRPQSALVRGGNQARAAQIGAAQRGWNYQQKPGTPSAIPAWYNPNAPLGPIGGVQNDPRYAANGGNQAEGGNWMDQWNALKASGNATNEQLNQMQASAAQNQTSSPYPTSPYEVSGVGPGAFQSNGQSFSVAGTNADGTINWVRSDGTRFDNLSQSEFAKYFGNDVAGQYYGAQQAGGSGQYQANNIGANSFSAGGNQFNVTRNPDGTVSLARSDGQNINNLSQQDFTRYFGADLAKQYYGSGGGSGNVSNGGTNIQGVNPPTTTGNESLYGMGIQGLGMGLQPFNTQFYNQLGNSMFQQATQNYNDNINPALNSAAITAGGYGGDRSNLAKGVMMDRMNQSVFNSLIPQVTGGYENWLNRGVQAGQSALNSDVNYGNLGLGYYGADTQRQLGTGTLGVNQYNAETNRQLGVGGLQNQNYDSYLRALLGAGTLDVSGYEAQNRAAGGAANAAGVQSYTNPWAAGIGTAISMWPFLNGMFGSTNTTTPT